MTKGRDEKRKSSRSLNAFVPSTSNRVSPAPAIITLTTDFGTNDYFVAAMKGAIFSINPHAQIVDITHTIPPQDIQSAAFTLFAAYRSFPQGTIHLAVVDPGVGSSRAPLLVEATGQFFVGPDNGIFSYICEQERDHRVVRLTNRKFFADKVSSTFHGRDVFAPVAAAVSVGVAPDELGEVTLEFVRLDPLAIKAQKDKATTGRIIHIDNFGNCVTNLTRQNLSRDLNAGARLRINGKTIKTFKTYFCEDVPGAEKLFGIWGSAGFLEIATTNGSAAKLLQARRGQTVTLEFSQSKTSPGHD